MDKAHFVDVAGQAADLSSALAMAIEGAEIDAATRSALHALASVVAAKCAEISAIADTAQLAE